MTWLGRILVAFDQMTQAACRSGLPGETISARAGKAMIRYQRGQSQRQWGCVLCRFLDLIETDHCVKAIANDRARAQAVIDDLSGL